MTRKQPSVGHKAEKPSEADRKKRLADALRRNLAKRKGQKDAKNVDNP